MGFSVKKLKNLEVGESEKTVLNSEDLFKAAMTLRAINNPLRKKIIEYVNANKDTPVNKIYKSLKIEQSVASQHLAILRKTEFLIGTRNGKFIYYSVNEKRFAEIRDLLESI